MIEEWKDIEGYTDYMVSNLGRVKSLNYRKTDKEQVLKNKIDKDGYLLVNLYKNGKSKTFKIHRLVAQAFIPNSDNKPFIDHINTNRSDNRVENLRWVTHKENMNNDLTLIKCSKSKKAKPILQFDLNDNFIRRWYCIKDVERELGFNQGSISACCSSKRKTSHNYIWKYESDYELIPFKVFDLKIYRKKVAIMPPLI